MAASIPASSQLNWGVRHVRFFRLDSDGNISRADTSGYLTPYRYDGIQVVGATAFQINEPPPRTVDFPGDDGVVGSDSMPALQGETAQVTASPWDYDILALLENVKIVSGSGRRRISRGTNKAGSEPRMGVLYYQQSVDLDTGARKWHATIYPSAKVTPIGAGGGDSPQQTQYQIVPTSVKKHLWGATMTTQEDGAIRQRKVEWEGFFRPFITRLYTDGATLTFELDDDHPIGDDETAELWLNGVKMANGYTISVANNNVVLDAPHTEADALIMLYEEAENE